MPNGINNKMPQNTRPLSDKEYTSIIKTIFGDPMNSQIRKPADTSIKGSKINLERDLLNEIENICKGYEDNKILTLSKFSILDYEGTDDYLRLTIWDGVSRFQIEFAFKACDKWGNIITKINICGLKEPKAKCLIKEDVYKFNVSKEIGGPGRADGKYLAKMALTTLYEEVENYNKKDIKIYTVYFDRVRVDKERVSCSAENPEDAMEKFDTYLCIDKKNKKFVTKLEVEDKDGTKKSFEYDNPEEYLSKKESDKRECESVDCCENCTQNGDEDCWGAKNGILGDECEDECCGGDCDCCERDDCEPADSVEELEEDLDIPNECADSNFNCSDCTSERCPLDERPADEELEFEEEDCEDQELDEELTFDQEVEDFVLNKLPDLRTFSQMPTEERKKILDKMRYYSEELLKRDAKNK